MTMRRVAWWRRLKRMNAVLPSYLSASASDCSINANAALQTASLKSLPVQSIFLSILQYTGGNCFVNT